MSTMLLRVVRVVFAGLVACGAVWAQTGAPSPGTALPGIPVQAASGSAQTVSFEISGVVRSGKTPLPGVTVTAANSLTGKKITTSTDTDGTYAMTLPSRGKYVVRAEMAGFAVATGEAVINPTTPKQRIELEMPLLSRARKTESGTSEVAQALGAMAGRGSQQLSLSGNAEGLAVGANGGDVPLAGMPAMAGTSDANNESLAVSGQVGNSQDFGMRNMDDLRDRIEQMRERGELQGMGGPGGGMGGGPGGGGVFILGGPGGLGGRGGRGAMNMNRPHGSLFYSVGNSALDATPYSLTGTGDKPSYGSNRFGGMVGGPLNIPHIYNGGMKTFFFANYTGTRATTPYQVFSRVPTDLERAGNFSQTYYTSGPNDGQLVELYDPLSHGLLPGCTPTGGCVLSPAQISATSAGLLNYYPHENLPGQTLNYRFTDSADTDSDSFNLRLIHNFGAAGGLFGGGPGGMGGGGRGSRVRNNLNLGISLTRNESQILRPFTTVGGTSSVRGMNINGGYSVGKNRLNNVFRVTYNQQKTSITNYYANVLNVSGSQPGGLNIVGASSDPANWGVPGVSFTNFGGLTDVSPQARNDRTLSFNDTIGWTKGKHNLRFGGGYSRLWTDLKNNVNPNGTFTFTGAATAAVSGGKVLDGTGYDLADFLLNAAQQATIQYGPFEYNFVANSISGFVQDDWRVRSNLTLDLGLRYEYQGPYKEMHNRMANLDAAPGFVSVAPVLPGQAGPYTGFFPSSLVYPDRNNFAPRVGLAWKPMAKTVVRGGYGINYNLGQYRSVVNNLAYQPPFSYTQTSLASVGAPISMNAGFAPLNTTLITNNYGIDKNYRLGYVQLWNVNIQRDLPKNFLLNVGYNGAKGTALDMMTAPNRAPDGGLLIDNAQAFLWETSAGSSILHAGTVRVRKRMSNGVQMGGTYVYSKSIDNASSIGGGALVVAQNPYDLAAERGLSSFDVRHRFTGDYVYEIPFGDGKRWFRKAGLTNQLMGNWTWSGSLTLATGNPYTARVIGNYQDVARGSNGSLRANYNGQPITVSNPNAKQWFNTAAFTVPMQGTYGTAGRNTIEGPGTVLFNMAVAKSFPMKDMMGFEVRLEAQNVFNHPVYTSIDTTVNSPNFGQVISVGSMRKVQVFTRFRF
jgi:trimeric autotransporter adhesin